MDPQNGFNILSDFYSPLGVGVIVFVVGAIHQFWARRQEVKRQKVTVLDDIIIALKSADQTLENLKNDDNGNYFNYNNQKKAKRVAERLEKAIEGTAVFPDENLRKEILQSIEDFNTLAQDVEGLENYAFSQSEKFSQTRDKSLDELKRLKLEALKVNIFIGDSAETISGVDSKQANDQGVEVVRTVYGMLDRTYIEAKDQLDKSEDFCKQRRVHLTIRIVDTQTKLRELNSRLQLLRESIASSW